MVATVVSGLYSSSKLSAEDSPCKESGRMIPWVTSFSLRFSEMASGARVWAPGMMRVVVSGASSLSPVSPEDSSSDSATKENNHMWLKNRTIPNIHGWDLLVIYDRLYHKLQVNPNTNTT